MLFFGLSRPEVRAKGAGVRQKRKGLELDSRRSLIEMGKAGRAFPHGNLFQFAPALLHCAQTFLLRSKSRCCWSCGLKIMP